MFNEGNYEKQIKEYEAKIKEATEKIAEYEGKIKDLGYDLHDNYRAQNGQDMDVETSSYGIIAATYQNYIAGRKEAILSWKVTVAALKEALARSNGNDIINNPEIALNDWVRYFIVDPNETEPEYIIHEYASHIVTKAVEKGDISTEAPNARAFLGKKVGDVLTVSFNKDGEGKVFIMEKGLGRLEVKNDPNEISEIASKCNIDLSQTR